MTERPSVRLTVRVLSAGSLAAAICFAIGLALDVLAFHDMAHPLSAAGVIVLLGTPVAGLLTTYGELRGSQPRAAWLALAIVAILGAATVAAVLTR
jgi:hypothetical protein